MIKTISNINVRELHWLKIIVKRLLFTHKAVNNTAPEYLHDLIRFKVSHAKRNKKLKKN